MNIMVWLESRGNYVKLTVAVILLAAAIRFLLAAVSHPAGDSCYHLSVARFIAESSRLPLFEPFGISDRMVFSAPPLFHIAAAAVYKISSLFSVPAAEFAVKLASPLFGSLALPFVFLIGRRLYSSRIAFFATLFVAFLPLHISSSVVSFVDSLAALLAAAAIYLVLSRKILLAAVAVGLGLLAKQTMIFLLPVFFFALFVNYRSNLKIFLKTQVERSRLGPVAAATWESAAAAAIIAVIGLPWLIRNYVLLGNPFWPFLYGIFGGSVVPEGISGSFSLASLFSLQHPVRFFLELFGAPVGNLSLASFANLPFSGVLVAVWLAASAVFFLPVVLGVFAKGMRRRSLISSLGSYPAPLGRNSAMRNAQSAAADLRNNFPVKDQRPNDYHTPQLAVVGSLIYVWIASFLAVTALYIMSLGIVSARFILPAAPALGILWALGVDRILGSRSGSKAAAVVLIIIFGCVFIFSAVESAKTVVAARAWGAYSGDFSWIKENTPPDALIAYRGQCLSYNVHRFSSFDLSKADYVWVNQGFRLEPVSVVEPGLLQQVQNSFVRVYFNGKTGTEVYKRK